MAARDGWIALQAEANVRDEVGPRRYAERELEIQEHGNTVSAHGLVLNAG